MKLASFLLRGDSSVFLVFRVCAHVWVFLEGKIRECIMMVKVYNHRYSRAEVPSLLSLGIFINSSNSGHHNQ